jgi:hypothetical protein
MELTYLVFTGSLAGLVSILGHAVIWSAAELTPAKHSPVLATTSLDVTDVLLHLIAGAGLAVFFWLSWGLAAIVDVGWWLRGLCFGALSWSALALPAVISVSLGRTRSIGEVAVLAARWGTTCLAIGLACAWSWERHAY